MKSSWIAVLGSGPSSLRPSEALVCHQFETLELCLTQVHSGQLDEVAAGLAPVLAGLDVPVRMVEGAGLADAPEIGLNSLYVGPTLMSGPDLAVIRSDLATGLMRWGCATQTPYGTDYIAPQAVIEAAYPLEAWLAARPQDPPSFTVLGDLTDDQLVGAIRAYRKAASACDAPAALGALAPLTPS